MHSMPLTTRTLWCAVAVVFFALVPSCSSCTAPAAAGGEGEGEGASGEGEGASGEGEGEGNPPGAPDVVIDAPADGSFVKTGATTTFRCHGTDASGAAIPNGSIRWRASVDGALGTGNVVQNALTTSGDQTITCAATDANNVTGTANITVHVVDNLPPVVTIETPQDGEFFGANASITFHGTANDPETGPVASANLAWSDGTTSLGSGATVTTALALGDHTITLTAPDPDGGPNGTATVTIHVVSNVPPQCTITSPTDGGSVVVGQSTTFSATCTNPDGAAVNNGDITWTSSVDGNLGAGATVQTALTTRGTQTITVCAKDPADATVVGCTSITVTVGDNASPVATIVRPNAGDVVAPCQQVSLRCTAVDPDGTVASIVWTDSNGDTIPAGGEVTWTPQTAGAHTLTCTATDNLGATGTATVNVTVEDPGAVIQNPRNGDGFQQQDTIQLQGNGCSFANDQLPGTDLSWTVDGNPTVVATGNQGQIDASTLSLGQHTITLTVTDANGSGTDSVTIHVGG